MACSSESPAPGLRGLFKALEESALVSYVVDANLQIKYCNAAWDQFAQQNDAPELVGNSMLGLDLRTVLCDDLRPYYLKAFAEAAKSGKVWETLYECSSPNLFRKFHMRLHPLQQQGWFLITNALVIEAPHSATAATNANEYQAADSSVAMCCHCRRSRSVLFPDRWDFVPAHVKRGFYNISHSLCPLCLEYFYPRPEN